MIKYYCDLCGKETKINRVTERLVKKIGDIWIEAMVAVKGTWNSGVLCENCVIKVVSDGKHLNQP